MYLQNSLATPLALTHQIHLPITADSDPTIPEFPDAEGMRLLRHLVAYAAGTPTVRATLLEARLAPRLRGVWRQTAGIRPTVAGARPVSVRVRRSARRAEFATVWVAGGRGFAATLEVTYTDAGKWLMTNWAIL
jgi:hypothetical protein